MEKCFFAEIGGPIRLNQVNSCPRTDLEEHLKRFIECVETLREQHRKSFVKRVAEWVAYRVLFAPNPPRKLRTLRDLLDEKVGEEDELYRMADEAAMECLFDAMRTIWKNHPDSFAFFLAEAESLDPWIRKDEVDDLIRDIVLALYDSLDPDISDTFDTLDFSTELVDMVMDMPVSSLLESAQIKLPER